MEIASAMEKRANAENLQRRKNNFFERGNEMCTVCGVDMFILISKKDKCYTFQNMNSPTWLPTKEYMVSDRSQMLYDVLTVLGKEDCFLEGSRRFQSDISHEEALEEGLRVSSRSFHQPF
jgi:hypothetical protein